MLNMNVEQSAGKHEKQYKTKTLPIIREGSFIMGFINGYFRPLTNFVSFDF
jgi:hypothetical protein